MSGKRVHKAVAVNQRGGVAALCSPVPRAISMTKASWTLTNRFVTCPKCLEALAAEDRIDEALNGPRSATTISNGET